VFTVSDKYLVDSYQYNEEETMEIDLFWSNVCVLSEGLAVRLLKLYFFGCYKE
jgi:hypothetical protein